MNFQDMSLDELKAYAKSIGIKVGNIGKEKLIEKIEKAEESKAAISSVIEDDDLEPEAPPKPLEEPEEETEGSLLDAISSVIDDLDESVNEDEELVTEEELPNNTVIPVKSLVMGGLTYRSKISNALFRWNGIGSVVNMTVSELMEMNNHKRDFLNKPLVILMDERAIKKFRLTPLYENVAKINNLKKVFSSDMATIEKTIDTALDVNMRDILVSKITHMIKNKTLVDINIIRFLSKKLAYDFEDILTQQ